MNVFKRSIVYSAIGLILIGLIAIIIGAAFGGLTGNFKFGDTTDISEKYSDISSINIEYGAGTLYIKSGDEFRIEGTDVYKDYFKSEVKDGVWYISDSAGRSGWFADNFRVNIGRWKSTHSAITIYIPQDYVLDEVKIKLGAGKLDADGFETVKFNLQVGAGDVNMHSLVADRAQIECGVGSIKIGGTITGDSKIECGVGSVRLNLSGEYTDYNYKIKVGLGSASVNSSKYDGSTDTTIDNPGAKSTFDIEAGLGEINIQFDR